MNQNLFPVLFIGHGSPINAVETNEFTEQWAEVGKQLPKPDAIVCISAHWQTLGSSITLSRHPRTIHDFGGFPRSLYDVTYPATGEPELARKIMSMLSTEITGDLEWGFDHGCWSILSHMYPEGNIPVVQFSLDENLSPRKHFELGKELAFLRKQNVLILCSGNIIHNLKMLDWSKLNDPEYGYDWATAVNNLIKNLILTNKFIDLCSYPSLGIDVQRAIPTPDHFLPVLYALALKEPEESVRLFNDKLIMGSLSMTSFIIQ